MRASSGFVELALESLKGDTKSPRRAPPCRWPTDQDAYVYHSAWLQVPPQRSASFLVETLGETPCRRITRGVRGFGFS